MTSVELRDSVTNEPVMHPVPTQLSMVEKALFQAASVGGLLFSHIAKPSLVEDTTGVLAPSWATLSGGRYSETTLFSAQALQSNYRYTDAGNIDLIVDESELLDLHYLADLCGRNKLAVHKPRQLASAVVPCLTYDRNAHLGVCLGEQPCGIPGES
jgi:hypothetical protein